LSFFTLVAGPIQRYNDFQAFWLGAGLGPADARDSLWAWSRVLTGMFKVGALSAIALHFFEDAGHRLLTSQSDVLQHFAVYFYAYPIYMYFNFSGYTDIVIGVAQLLGLKLPENFNHPFLARNVIDYWNRWHITLTHWIRDYVFMTSYKWAVERVPSTSRLAGYFLLFFALFLAGLWHGSTSGFAVFGLLHGIGVATNRMYGDGLKSWLGRAGVQRYEKNKLIRVAAIVLTFHFICFTFVFFSSGVPMALRALRLAGASIGSPHVAGFPVAGHATIVAALAMVLVLLVLWRADPLLAFFGRISQGWQTRSLYWLVIAKTLGITLMLLLLWAIELQEPVVAYMAF
jgi:alginate O-acetyltransferase complex protein AlgI